MKIAESLVMIYENGLIDARVECTLANEGVTELFALEMCLLESHEIELGEVKRCLKKSSLCILFTCFSSSLCKFETWP
jgi:hypothetical protein